MNLNKNKWENQISIFEVIRQQFKIDKTIRLIELFAGVGSQAMALRDLGAKFEHYKIAEWEVGCINSYKAIHIPDDSNNYSDGIEKKQLIEILYRKGISSDGKKPLTKKQIYIKGEKWLRTVYNNIHATNNLCSITNFNGRDLGIRETDKYYYIMTYSFPCQDLSVAGKQKGMSKGSGTRSGMLWEVERLLDETEHFPQILLMENVP
jgi:DNA (cytosine-5)-methyltransferase 1